MIQYLKTGILESLRLQVVFLQRMNIIKYAQTIHKYYIVFILVDAFV